MTITHSLNPGPQHGVTPAGATNHGEQPALPGAGCFISISGNAGGLAMRGPHESAVCPDLPVGSYPCRNQLPRGITTGTRL